MTFINFGSESINYGLDTHPYLFVWNIMGITVVIGRLHSFHAQFSRYTPLTVNCVIYILVLQILLCEISLSFGSVSRNFAFSFIL